MLHSHYDALVYLIQGLGWAQLRIWFSFRSRETINYRRSSFSSFVVSDPDSRQAQAHVVQIPALATKSLCTPVYIAVSGVQVDYYGRLSQTARQRSSGGREQQRGGEGEEYSPARKALQTFTTPNVDLAVAENEVQSCLSWTSSLRCLRPIWTRREFGACGLRICCHGRPSSWSSFGQWVTRCQAESGARLLCV